MPSARPAASEGRWSELTVSRDCQQEFVMEFGN